MSNQERKQQHIYIMLGVVLLGAALLFFVPPIAQPLAYHNFADSRSIIGIPNFMDVISNLLILFAGSYGLKLLLDPRDGVQRSHFESSIEAIPYITFFMGAVLTSFGSAYYHISPDNFSLAWDRLPITIMITSFLAAVISERIHQKTGLILLPLLVGVGIFSVGHWHQTELAGAGDLRLYLAVQFLPILLSLYMLFFLRSRYSRGDYFGWAILLYALAKAAEIFDHDIFTLLLQWVSGHTLKHVFVAIAMLILAEMLRCRIPVNKVQQAVSELDDY